MARASTGTEGTAVQFHSGLTGLLWMLGGSNADSEARKGARQNAGVSSCNPAAADPTLASDGPARGLTGQRGGSF